MTAASAFVLAERRLSREVRLRTVSALVLGSAALLVLWAGGIAWVTLIVLCAGLLAAEWAGLAVQAMTWPARASVLLAGVPYVGCAAIALIWLRGDTAGARSTLFLIAAVWGSDIGAFVAGRTIGGRRLWPAVSPGKTWSGAAGGLVAALAACAAVAASWGGAITAGVLGAALLLALASEAGDLLESAIKRGFGVKDSSGLIPGHGGVLDRLDGMLVAAPVAAWMVWHAGPGTPLWSALR